VTAKPNVVMLWGQDQFLLREAALELLGDVHPTEVDAGEWQGGETADLATPSLFGEDRALLVTDCRRLPEHGVREIAAYAAAPAPDATLVLLAEVGERGKAPAALAKALKDHGEVREVAVERKSLGRWVADRAKRKHVQIRTDAVAALIEALGEQPAVLDQALEQLAAAFPGAAITKTEVASQFRGLGEQRMWDLCDRAFGRDLDGSMRSLASLMDVREDLSLPILGALASRIRDLLRVKALPDSAPPAEIARAAGLRFDWQGRKYRDQARGFTMTELVALHGEIVEADRVLKSGGAGDVVLPVLISKVAAGAG
jgi:DNA polymerase III subunit delta